ncbi:MAG: prenyltransferase/squalene oxidase repeat-containing protein [Anaerolineae bacterium]
MEYQLENFVDFTPHMRRLLTEIGSGKMTNTAYDTAWIARLHELGEPMAEEALEWLRAHQLADGSWGAREPLYYHDRVISSLAAVIALARRGLAEDRMRIQRALPAIHTYLGKLHLDPAGETIAFEMLLPTLMAEAKKLNLVSRGGTVQLNAMTTMRESKLARTPGRMINRHVTMAFSAELAGKDGRHILDIPNLQEANGSVGFSPSATAYYALNVNPRNAKALSYLRSIFDDRGAPNVAPIDIFETAWTLWNLAQVGPLDKATITLCQPHLDFLEEAWDSQLGIGHAAGFTPRDGDDTGLVYEVLSRFGRSVSLDAVLGYEEDEHFRCFPLEANPSISANIHILGALRQAGLPRHHSSVQKIFRFLRRNRLDGHYWLDKWHASPYYTTAHAVIVAAGYESNLVRNAIAWILETQNEDGSWGYYKTPTAEETAYCLQALSTWARIVEPVPLEALQKGAAWLHRHIDQPYLPLWIGKGLYAPTMVVKSTILSALMMSTAILVSPFSRNGHNGHNGHSK